VTLSRDRRRGKKKYLARKKLISDPWGGMCPNGCGGPGPHFVPPSMGDAGFFICTRATSASAHPETEASHG
jgi:hypothetical protein